MSTYLLDVKPMVLLASLLVETGLAGCAAGATTTEPVDGHVMDIDNHVPVAGAVVLAAWGGEAGIVEPQRYCAHVETTLTDATGAYHFSGGTKLAPRFRGGAGVQVYAYKEGYQLTARDGRADVLKPAEGDAAHRFDLLFATALSPDLRACGTHDGSNFNLYELHGRQYRELSALLPPNDKERAMHLNIMEMFRMDDLVNYMKPTHDVQTAKGMITVNVNPLDAFQPK